MEIRVKNAAGTVMLLAGLPAMAQEAVANKAASSVGYPTCPKIECSVVTPPGPDVLFALVAFGIGVVVGAALAKVLGGKKAQ